MADPDELLKKAGGFFSKLGGSIKLEVDQTKIAPGGTIRGRVVLALPEAIDAKRLVVTLRARQKVMNVHRSSSGRTISTSHADVYAHDRELGGTRAYESGTIEFELAVPPDALDLRPSAGANPIADAVRVVASALSPSAGPIEWQVVARLAIPWGRDLSDDVDIVVAR